MDKIPEYNEFREAVVKKLVRDYDGYGMDEKEIRELLERPDDERVMREYYMEQCDDVQDGTRSINDMMTYGVGLASSYYGMCW